MDEIYVPSSPNIPSTSSASNTSNASTSSSDSDLDFEQAIENAQPRSTGRRGRGRERGRGRSRGKSQEQTGTVAVSRSELRHQPPDPFSGSKLTVAPDAKNAFDVMGKAKKRNKKKRTHPLTANSKQPSVKRRKGDDRALISARASGSGVRSSTWNWFSEERIDGIRHGICIVQMPDGKPCGARIRTGDSTTNLWRHLKGRHGYNQSGEPPVTCSER